MKPEKLKSILKNLNNYMVYKEYKDVPKNAQERKDKKNWPLKKDWFSVAPEVLKRIELQLANAKNQVKYYGEERQVSIKPKVLKVRDPEKLVDAKFDVEAYTQILARLT